MKKYLLISILLSITACGNCSLRNELLGQCKNDDDDDTIIYIVNKAESPKDSVQSETESAGDSVTTTAETFIAGTGTGIEIPKAVFDAGKSTPAVENLGKSWPVCGSSGKTIISQNTPPNGKCFNVNNY
jgi:hypothetical protein